MSYCYYPKPVGRYECIGLSTQLLLLKILYLKGIVELRTCKVEDPMMSASLLSYFKGLNPYPSGKLKQRKTS